MPLAHKSAVVDSESPWVGQRSDRLVQELCGLSRSQVTGLFDRGCVTVNGALVLQPAQRLTAGSRVELKYDPHQRYHPTPKARRNLGFEIVFEDRHLIVVNKPAALLTVPTRAQETNTLQHRVEEYVRHVGKARGAFPVHRLDRGVSGLLVLGKTAEIVVELKDQFAASKPEREYIAIVAGRVAPMHGTFESLLATDRNLNRFSTDDERIGQVAITHYRVVTHLEGATLVQVRLETGRRNQIRVHFAEAGHPVLGDERYGFREIEAGQPARAVRRSKSPRDKLTSAPKYDRAALPPWPHERLALHARLLGFTHPVTGEAMRFETSVPEEMEQLLREHRPRS